MQASELVQQLCARLTLRTGEILKMRKSLWMIPALFLLVALGTPNVHADTTITTSCTTAGPALIELGPANGTLMCNEAGPTNLGGALQSITINLTGAIVSPSTLTVKNGGATFQTVSGTASTTFSLDPSDPAGFTLTPFTAMIDSGGISLAPGASGTVSVSGSNMGLINVLPLGSYDNPLNTFSFAADTLSSGSGGGDGGITVGAVFYAQASANVTYDYASIATPEPSSLLLLSSGLVGLGFMKRKVFQKWTLKLRPQPPGVYLWGAHCHATKHLPLPSPNVLPNAPHGFPTWCFCIFPQQILLDV